MALGLITLFGEHIDLSGKISRFQCRHAYAVFFIHASVITFLAIALSRLSFDHLLTFRLVAVIAVLFCFAVAWLVLKMPGCRGPSKNLLTKFIQ